MRYFLPREGRAAALGECELAALSTAVPVSHCLYRCLTSHL